MSVAQHREKSCLPAESLDEQLAVPETRVEHLDRDVERLDLGVGAEIDLCEPPFTEGADDGGG